MQLLYLPCNRRLCKVMEAKTQRFKRSTCTAITSTRAAPSCDEGSTIQLKKALLSANVSLQVVDVRHKSCHGTTTFMDVKNVKAVEAVWTGIPESCLDGNSTLLIRKALRVKYNYSTKEARI